MASEKLMFRLEQPHGSGDIYASWQGGSGSYLAITGCDSTVTIFDRYGSLRERIKLQGLCTGFGWDNDGDLLAVISSGSNQLLLWDSHSEKKQSIDLGLRDPVTCLLWSKTEPVVAVGTAKGNLSIYNHNTARRIPIIGKHTKKITCGAWSSRNLLALGSNDCTVSISSADGENIRIIHLRGEPSNVEFSEMKMDERIGGENTVSMIVGKKTLYLYNLVDPENPVELSFQSHYGSVVTYKWFGDGYILLGFNGGYFVAISTHIREVGQELFQIKNHRHNLSDIAVSDVIGKVASCGDNVVKIHDMSNLKETSSVLSLSQEAGVERISWSEDGQLLAVCTRQGSLNVYLTKLSTLTSVCGARIAILSSLMEVDLYTYLGEKTKQTQTPLKLEIEPNFLAVGPYHMAAGMNNRAWFYDLSHPDNDPVLLKDREYLGAVTSIKLSPEYASVLYEGKIHLHLIEQPDAESEDDRESKIFPEANIQGALITSHAITTEFLIYCSDMGHLHYFSLEEWAFASEFKHAIGIRSIYVDPAGSRLIFIDDKIHGYVYNAVNGDVIEIQDLPNTTAGVIWDKNLADRNVFIVYDSACIYTYIYIKFSIYGSSIECIGKTDLLPQQMPLLLYSGDVILGTSDGQITRLTLATHDSSSVQLQSREQVSLETSLSKQLDLQRYAEAWNVCQVLNRKECWLQLAEKAMKHLEIELALKVFHHIEDSKMVWSLEAVSDVEDYKLLAGHMAVFLGDFDRAEKWYMSSGYPTAALDMRKDLLQWEQALQLAKTLAPHQVAYIAREYAQQLEFVGNYAEAFVHYEKGLQGDQNPSHIAQCKSGIARTSIRCGNYKQGINIAIELNNKTLLKESADILESKKQIAEAALLYEKAGQYDRAASAYVKAKNWQKVGELIPNVTSSKIHLQFARAKEQEGKYDEAVAAYSVGKDYDSVIRLHLEHLNNPETAVELVQETKSVEGAKLVARFFQRLNDYTSAIQFLVISHCYDEAFELARKHGKLPLYGEVLVNSLSPDETRPQDFTALASYFEGERNHLLAGKYYFHAKEYVKAMKHLLHAAKSNTNENEALTSAIDVVASSNDNALFNQLVEFLLGESDGLPKDPKFLFRLYMAKKLYPEAAKTAVIIANEEQTNGNYRNAHDVLFGMCQELRRNNIRVPNDMYSNLMLLHSYILVRLHVRRGDHMKGARMLIRVANNISRFPSHIVPILTSTVIECHRAGLRFSAFTYATLLMRPEYRSQIDPKYSKKIEAVVRKPPRVSKDGGDGDPAESFTPCPYCETGLPETEVSCNQCKNNIPFCIATGRHLVKDDLTACPECDFPAIRSEFLQLVETEENCPMCTEKVEAQRLVKIENGRSYFYND